MTTTLDARIERIASLDDPVRRALYRYVASRTEPVGRDEAAEATGTSRENAAFHLDKLVSAGLLEASYRRLSGRAGPGAGRPSKLYRRSSAVVDVSLPARRFELAARVLAEAVRDRTGRLRAGVAAAARRMGLAVGAAARAGSPRSRGLRALIDVLDENGFEPVERPRGTVELRNCPFHEVARENPEVVCQMNAAFMGGVVDGLGATGVKAKLDPGPGRCCVTFRSRGAVQASGRV